MNPTTMTEDDRLAWKELMREALAECDTRVTCPFVPPMHEEHHEMIQSWLEFMAKSKNTAWEVIVKAVITFIIGVVGLGVYAALPHR